MGESVSQSSRVICTNFVFTALSSTLRCQENFITEFFFEMKNTSLRWMFEWEPRKSEMWNAVVIVVCMCLFPELSWPTLEANYIPERVSFIILPGLNFSVGISLQNAVTMLPNPSCLDLNLKPSLPTNCSVGSNLSFRLWPFSTF